MLYVYRNGVNQTTDEAHATFMQKYKDIFVKKPKKLGFPVHSEQRLGLINFKICAFVCSTQAVVNLIQNEIM